MSQPHCDEYDKLSRQQRVHRQQRLNAFTHGAELAAVPDWLPKVALADPHVGPSGDTLVCIFLRGGADGLNIIVPHGERHYYDFRPNLNIPRPDDRKQHARTVDLDGFFGLHPALAPLLPIYHATDLGIVHACGSPDETRSHFAAQTLMETGVSDSYSGWLARHLATLDSGNASPLRAIALSGMLTESLFGAKATVLRGVAQHKLQVGDARRAPIEDALSTLYGDTEALLAGAAEQTLATLALMRQVNAIPRPTLSRPYPKDKLGHALQTVAQLVRADVGVEVATIDFGGWDTHAAQGGVTGGMAKRLAILAEALAAFYEELEPLMQRITVVVMSEFGRRVHENGSGGTDHGHGNMMLLMGKGINGGQVHADWPGLTPEALAGPGDLDITTDYRDVLAELVRKRLKNPNLSAIFPHFQFAERGIVLG